MHAVLFYVIGNKEMEMVIISIKNTADIMLAGDQATQRAGALVITKVHTKYFVACLEKIDGKVELISYNAGVELSITI